MRESATIEGTGHVPAEPVLVIPNRVDLEVVQALEKLLGGQNKVAWLVERSLRPDAEVMNYLRQQPSPTGILFALEQTDRQIFHEDVRAALATGRHVVLLPGRPVQAPAAPADVPARLLHYVLDAYPRAVLPVYAGMFNLSRHPLVTTEAPYEKLVVKVMPLIPASAAPAAEVQAAWLNAGADLVSQLAEGSQDTLPQVLLRSLLNHPKATIIDGVDDTSMTYGRLLMQAALLAKKLRRLVTHKRIGIVLPPGKYAIIANVACLLSGIRPVNIDYTYDRRAYEQLTRLTGIDRIITEQRFMKRMRHFPWPPTRDIFLIDEELSGGGFSLSGPWNFLRRWLTPKRISKWLHTVDMEPHSEALVTFTPAEDAAEVSGVSLSHRAVLTGAAMSYSRFGVGEGKRVLSALPFHYRAGLISGLIYPLLMGQDIITYPLPDASKRLCALARQYKPVMAVFTPVQAREILKHAQEGDFASTTYFHVAGKVHIETAKEVYKQLRIYLCECYLPQESAMPIACNMAPPEVEKPTHALATGAPGTVGLLLPGVAIRITDIQQTRKVLPLSSTGLLWIRSAALFSGYAGQDAAADPRPVHERWVCTGDVAQLRPDGLLSVGGKRTRYSKINGEIVSHEMVEQLMLNFLHVEEQPGEPRLAVVGVPDEETGMEQLVLLSTVHRVVGPHDAITLRYDLTNEHISPNLAPGRIVAVRAIPTLPGGRVNYSICRLLAYRVLGINSH